MQIGGVRDLLTFEEKDRQRKNYLCLYCGKAGHFARDYLAKFKGPSKKAAVLSQETNLMQEK